MRTADHSLADAVSDLARGKMRDSSLAFVRSLDRPLPPSTSPKTVLYATNFSVWQHNKEALYKMYGDTFSFTADDEGEERFLAKLPVEKVK